MSNAEHPARPLCEQYARKRQKLKSNLAEQGLIECKLKDVDAGEVMRAFTSSPSIGRSMRRSRCKRTSALWRPGRFSSTRRTSRADADSSAKAKIPNDPSFARESGQDLATSTHLGAVKMQGTLYKRLFDRLTDLIPNLTSPREGASFYAPPRVEGEIASYCTVSKVQGSVCEVEIAHDTLVNGKELPAPWMVFRVDGAVGVAELLAVEDRWRYEVVYAEDDTPNPRRAQMNLFAVNNLTVMLSLGGAFRRVDVVEPVNA